MKETEGNKRRTLIRESLVFQLKLIADGLRDFALLPISLVATLVGVIRGGDEPEREFERVLDLGRSSEQWINLFGQHEPIQEAGRAGSIDMLLAKAEEVVRDQAKSGGITESASRAINKALAAVQDKAHESDPQDAKSKSERDIDI